ncbi:MAG TPA: hypothetical protein VF832_01570 [Longimicrobiales bacterium]
MIRPFRAALVLGAVALAAACGRETPTAVGGSLLTGGGARTFELVLDAPNFLQSDTTLTGFTKGASSTLVLIVAQGFGGQVNAHALARFVSPANTITVLDSTGTSKTDTAPSFFKGTVVLHIDTTAQNGSTPVQLRLFRTAEEFDVNSATWQFRVDTGNVHTPWATPGGTVGPLVDTVTWTPGQDSVIFKVDSVTVAQWRDTLNLGRGALVTGATPGSRLRFLSIGFNISAHSSIKKDTVVTSSTGNLGSTFLYDPPPPKPTAGILYVGGIPAWRSYLTLQPDLMTRTMTCPASAGFSCSFTLKSVTVNFAALVLQPAPAGAWQPEDSVRVLSFTVDTSSLVALSRAPLGASLGTTAPALLPSLFASPPSAAPASIPITLLLGAMAGDTVRTGTAAGQSGTIAILHNPEPTLFGIAQFYSRRAAPALAPKLRLIVTIAPQIQLP